MTYTSTTLVVLVVLLTHTSATVISEPVPIAGLFAWTESAMPYVVILHMRSSNSFVCVFLHFGSLGRYASPVVFLATVTNGSDVSYHWRFADGATANGSRVTHAFAPIYNATSSQYGAIVFATNAISAFNYSTAASYYQLSNLTRVVSPSDVIHCPQWDGTASFNRNARIAVGDIVVSQACSGFSFQVKGILRVSKKKTHTCATFTAIPFLFAPLNTFFFCFVFFVDTDDRD